jgi:hypothetical protein
VRPDRGRLPSIPAGVTTIAIAFFLAAAYLGFLGVIMLAFPGAVSMALGARLLSGLELAGPFMFLLMSGAAAMTGWGLLRLNIWARRIAIVVGFVGVVMLVPSVSAAAVDLRPSFFWAGLGLIVRVMIVWYLYQSPVAERFSKLPKST